MPRLKKRTKRRLGQRKWRCPHKGCRKKIVMRKFDGLRCPECARPADPPEPSWKLDVGAPKPVKSHNPNKRRNRWRRSLI